MNKAAEKSKRKRSDCDGGRFVRYYFQTLVADLEGDTQGDFEDLLVALVTAPDVYDCREVIRAIKVSLAGQ